MAGDNAGWVCKVQGRFGVLGCVRPCINGSFRFVTQSIGKRAREKARSSGQPKCLARFTRGLLRQKLKQLMIDYCSECLVRGERPPPFQPTARWFSGWQREYGLSMRKPNRKYKVPKAVMAERWEIGWRNVARIRALCLAEFGYDPEIENWDQSPFHHNESGSQNMPTLAVAGNGAIVPLIEGHSATRGRWTANLTTFSNEQRGKKALLIAK